MPQQYQVHRQRGRVSIRFLDHSPVIMSEEDAQKFIEYFVGILSDDRAIETAQFSRINHDTISVNFPNEEALRDYLDNPSRIVSELLTIKAKHDEQ